MNFCTIAIEAVGQEKAGDGESEIPMGPKCRKGAKLSRSRDGGKDLTNKLVYVLLDMLMHLFIPSSRCYTNILGTDFTNRC